MAPLVFKTSLGIVKVLGGFDSLPSPPSFALVRSDYTASLRKMDEQ